MDVFNKNKSLVYVNHFHFFHLVFRKILNSIKINNIYKFHIIDGDYGPFRTSISSLYDWGSHGLGIYWYLFRKFPEKIKIKKKSDRKKKGESWKIEFIISNKIVFKMLCGNGFSKKKRALKIFDNSKKDPIYFDLSKDKKLKKLPMDQMMDEFYNDIIKNKTNKFTIEIAHKTIDLLNLIENEL